MAEGRPEGWAHSPTTVAGKRVLVTGGTTGIGRAIARLLASQGAHVMIYGRDQKALDEGLRDIKAVAKGKAVGITADQSDREQIRRIFQEVDRQLGGLDVLVNNAGLAAEGTGDMSPEDIEYVLKTNLLGYMLCAHEAIERMAGHGGGHIVNIGSMSAETRGAGSGVYVATKSGIQGWNEATRKELMEQGIRVSLLEFGKVGSNIFGEPPDVQDQRQKISEQKMLTAEDIAEAVYYCLIQPPRCDILTIQLSPHMQGH